MGHGHFFWEGNAMGSRWVVGRVPARWATPEWTFMSNRISCLLAFIMAALKATEAAGCRPQAAFN